MAFFSVRSNVLSMPISGWTALGGLLLIVNEYWQ
jgi:hypothetical protein